MTGYEFQRLKEGWSESAIRPEILASKLSAIRKLTYPKLSKQLEQNPWYAEVLWFFQKMSMQPGGLNEFVRGFVEHNPERARTAAMTRFDRAGRTDYTVQQWLELWKEIPRSSWAEADLERLGIGDTWFLDLVSDDFSYSTPRASDSGFENNLKARLKQVGRAGFQTLGRNAALDDLARYFASLCNEISSPLFAPEATWYFDDLAGALREYLQVHPDSVLKRLAATSVTKKVFKELEFACSEKGVVQIFGDSRFGNTESARAWCLAYPGRARFVEVPPGNVESDLIKAMADAVGIEDIEAGIRDVFPNILANGNPDYTSVVRHQKPSKGTPQRELQAPCKPVAGRAGGGPDAVRIPNLSHSRLKEEAALVTG